MRALLWGLALHNSERHPIPTRPSRILVLAREPLAAALLGMLLELESYEPAFARAEETPEEALRRVRPVLVILLDGSLDAAASDVFRARVKGTPLIIFGMPGTIDAVRALAEERGLWWFSMPIERASLARVIKDASSSPTRSGRDRRRPTARQAPDGTLIYRDREGSKWRVYDRRAGERRTHTADDGGYRAFVNDAGEEWRYAFTGTGDEGRSAATLERQLAAAVRHSS